MVKLMYLGHSAFLLEAGGRRIMFDPWIAGNPRCPVKTNECEGADIYAVSHSHADHGLDDAIELSKRKKGKVVGIFEIAEYAGKKGADSVGANIGGPFEVNGVLIKLTQAVHSSDLGSPVGFVVKAGGISVYHAGDTGLFYDMKLIGELYRPDLALLPIGGHFTMDPREAAKAVELLGVDRVVPMHYGTFPVLYGKPEDLKRELRERGIKAEVIQLEPGESREL
ncbi:MAG: metal-dependent hydrolase [Candidatus Methanodesulfokora sp.]|jgi:L-ascorbate metabolism protein UlaG (beta-lactamase superfamily)|nr:MAG: metal-dependent hydrolase [Candidatus Korarchaeota archaeon]